MPRPAITPLMNSIKALIEAIDIDQGGGEKITVGIGEAPNCPPPYAIISLLPSVRGSGPIADPEADGSFRVQITTIGESQESANIIRDVISANFDLFALNTVGVTGMFVNNLYRDLTRDAKEEQGLTSPLFSAVDQYIVGTTPAS